MNKYVEQLSANTTKSLNDILIMALPDQATLARISAIQYGHKGKTVYSYEGVAFLEVWPAEIEYVQEGNAYTMRVTHKYRIIKGDTT